MTTDLIVLNGGSSSGKTSIARRLQCILPEAWLSISIDTLVDAMPPSLDGDDDGVSYGNDGEVELGEAFKRLESAWMLGISAMARAGAKIVLDDVFLDGEESQNRLRNYFEGLNILWIGVRCAPEVATAREAARADRSPGMAAQQSDIVHCGVTYDLEVDSSVDSAATCAQKISEHIN